MINNKFSPNTNIYKASQQTNTFITYSRKELFLQKVKKIIDANITNEQFGVNMLAQKVHLSVSQLNRKLKNLNGQSAGQFIRSTRMNYAITLLENDSLTIGEIAYQVGYLNQTHFCRSFKRKFGCTPSQYLVKKNKMRENGQEMRENGQRRER